MKIKLMVASTLVLFGFSVNANLNDFTQKAMDVFEDEGFFDNLTNKEIDTIEYRLKNIIDEELVKFSDEEMRLGETNIETFLGAIGDVVTGAVDAIKNVGGTVISVGGKLAGQALDMANTIAKEIGPVVQTYGPSLLQLAGEMKPEYKGAALALANTINGLSEKQAEGAVAAVQPKDGEVPQSNSQVVANALALLTGLTKQTKSAKTEF